MVLLSMLVRGATPPVVRPKTVAGEVGVDGEIATATTIPGLEPRTEPETATILHQPAVAGMYSLTIYSKHKKCNA